MKIGIYGYGNLGKGVEAAISKSRDMELVGVFTRRDPSSLKIKTEGGKVYHTSEIEKFKDVIDVMIICGGSATDLPEMTPTLSKLFNVVDSFDTHAKIPEHFENVDKAANSAKTTAVISAGWDPGMFSLNRLYASAILPKGKTYTFWGKGISQGHSDAIRRIEGVIDARQYTIPQQDAIDRVKLGENPDLTTREKHLRECFVVAQASADKERIEKEIKEMPNYFSDYDTIVHFITEDELKREHSGMPHGGMVIHSGYTGWNDENKHVIEYKLTLDSNPEFTASVLVATARAAYKMNERGIYGCKTMFDIAPADLSEMTSEELRKNML